MKWGSCFVKKVDKKQTILLAPENERTLGHVQEPTSIMITGTGYLAV